MPSSTPTPTSREALDQLDSIDTRLYNLRHLFEFIADTTCAIPIDGECNNIKAETITAIFRRFSQDMQEISSADMAPIRRFVAAIEFPEGRR